MKFAAVIEYLQDPERVHSLRPAHRQYLTQLKERGQIAATGPFTDGSGALIIYEAADRDEAEQLLKGDPFSKNGVFVSYVLRPWNPVIANRELFPAT
ncbi:MAG TPA: YciI family protein [Gemmataceae bacterium]|nr:YciI family protein [Gemmataceae bacterium]